MLRTVYRWKLRIFSLNTAKLPFCRKLQKSCTNYFVLNYYFVLSEWSFASGKPTWLLKVLILFEIFCKYGSEQKKIFAWNYRSNCELWKRGWKVLCFVCWWQWYECYKIHEKWTRPILLQRGRLLLANVKLCTFVFPYSCKLCNVFQWLLCCHQVTSLIALLKIM